MAHQDWILCNEICIFYWITIVRNLYTFQSVPLFPWSKGAHWLKDRMKHSVFENNYPNMVERLWICFGKFPNTLKNRFGKIMWLDSFFPWNSLKKDETFFFFKCSRFCFAEFPYHSYLVKCERYRRIRIGNAAVLVKEAMLYLIVLKYYCVVYK